MSALIINMPVTEGGRGLLLSLKSNSGLREQYPDGSLLREIDFDQLYIDVERFVDDCLKECGAQ